MPAKYICLCSRAILVGLFAQSAASAQVETSSDRLSGHISPFIGFDSNVSLTNDDVPGVDADSLSGGLSASGRYAWHRDRNTTVTANLNGFLIFNTDLDNFDVTGITPSIRWTQRLALGPLPATMNAAAGLQLLDVGGDALNTSQAFFLNGGVALHLSPTTSVVASLQVTAKDFDGDGFDPDTSSRDSTRLTPSVFVRWYLPDSRTSLNVGVTAVLNDADGLNNNYQSYTLSAGYRQPFLTPIGVMTGSLSASFGDRQHDDFTAQPRREQDVLSAGAGLTWQFREKWSAFGTLSWTDSDATRPDFSYNRARGSLGLTWSF